MNADPERKNYGSDTVLREISEISRSIMSSPVFDMARRPEMIRGLPQDGKPHAYNTRSNSAGAIPAAVMTPNPARTVSPRAVEPLPGGEDETDVQLNLAPPPEELPLGGEVMADELEPLLPDSQPSIWVTVDSRPLPDLDAERMATPLSVAIAICSLITTAQFAQRLQKLDKCYSNNVPGFVSALQTKHPGMYSAFTAVLGLTGSEARKTFMAAFDGLLAVFGGSAQSLFLVASAVWIMLSAESDKSAFLSMVLQAFLWTPMDEMELVRAAVTNSAAWSSLFATSATWIIRDVRGSPGYKRLNPASAVTVEDAKRCVTAWNELLMVLLSAISYSAGGPEIRALKVQLTPGTPANAQRDNELAVEYIARMTKSFYEAVAGLVAMGKTALVPHEDDVLVDIVAQGARRKTMAAFERIFTDDGFTEADMTWIRFQQYFIRAGHVADTKFPRLATPPTLDLPEEPLPESDEDVSGSERAEKGGQ